jgi:hypothetical protein
MQITELSTTVGIFQIPQIKALSKAKNNVFSNDFKGYIISLSSEMVIIE